jgi:hypothetical protein
MLRIKQAQRLVAIVGQINCQISDRLNSNKPRSFCPNEDWLVGVGSYKVKNDKMSLIVAFLSLFWGRQKATEGILKKTTICRFF